MDARILVCIPCHNRKAVAEQCLPTMRDSFNPRDVLALYNDGSFEYDGDWLRQFIPPELGYVDNRLTPIGIQAQRRLHLRQFLDYAEMTHVYFSDHDAIVDPTWRANALRLQQQAGLAPLCLYNTEAHVRITGNTILDEPASDIIWRRVAPGVSYLLTRQHVQSLMIEVLQHFDWQIPAMLGGRFAVSRVGYVDHIGYGGERHPLGVGYNGGDRVISPTEWLVAKRAEIVAKLQAQ